MENKKQNYVYIDGVKYDVTNFKHPGGSVISYYYGQDATDAFHAFHSRSEKAKKRLAAMKGVKVESEEIAALNPQHNQEMLADFRKLREKMVEKGFFDPDYMHVYLRLVEIAFYYGLGIFLIPYNIFAALFMMSMSYGRAAWLGHEAGHNSLTGNMTIDRAIQHMTYGGVLKLSSSQWNSMHNRHHAATQKEKYDIDLDTVPVVAFYKKAFENSSLKLKLSKWTRLWMRYQALAFIPISGYVVFYWIYYLHPLRVIRNRLWKEAAIMIASFVFVLSSVHYRGIDSWFNSFLFMNAALYFQSVINMTHFTLSHTFRPTVGENDNPEWPIYAINHSVNVSTRNVWVAWIMGYLNFQIEHHLFPSMPQIKNALAQKYVKRFCDKWKLTYIEIGYMDAWRCMFENLNIVGEHYSSISSSTSGGNELKND